MILGHRELKKCWKDKILRFEPDIDESQIGLCSIDLRLGYKVSRLQNNLGITVTPAITKSSGLFIEEDLPKDKFLTIKEGEFMTAITYESVSLPSGLAAMVEGRSTYARWGLSAHVTAPLIQPGWFGPITLELYNHAKFSLNLMPGQERVSQLILFKTSSAISPKIIKALSRYRGQTSPVPKPFNER